MDCDQGCGRFGRLYDLFPRVVCRYLCQRGCEHVDVTNPRLPALGWYRWGCVGVYHGKGLQEATTQRQNEERGTVLAIHYRTVQYSTGDTLAVPHICLVQVTVTGERHFDNRHLDLLNGDNAMVVFPGWVRS